MNVRLVVEQGGKHRRLNLQAPEAVVGRSRGNAVRIPSAEVSRRHCRLVLEDGLVNLEDLGSVNGTYLNGRRINKVEVVRPGDSLEVGPVKFVVEYELTKDASERLRMLENEGEMVAAVEEDSSPMDWFGEDASDMDATAQEVNLPPAEVDFSLLDASEEELPMLEVAEEDIVADADSDEEFELTLDSGAWEMPEGGDLREILSEANEDEPPTDQIRPGKKR
jgi:predicted component of type VI protein secretion system